MNNLGVISLAQCVTLITSTESGLFCMRTHLWGLRIRIWTQLRGHYSINAVNILYIIFFVLNYFPFEWSGDFILKYTANQSLVFIFVHSSIC